MKKISFTQSEYNKTGNNMDIKLIKKEIIKQIDDHFETKETRWFAETNDNFDGTAQGYGYKSPQAVYKAYHYFKNKNKYKNNAKNVKTFLNDNPDINNALEQYFDPQECLWRDKDREPTSIEHFVETMQEENPEIANKMLDQKHLWKAIEAYF